jgi:hypothetical protein
MPSKPGQSTRLMDSELLYIISSLPFHPHSPPLSPLAPFNNSREGQQEAIVTYLKIAVSVAIVDSGTWSGFKYRGLAATWCKCIEG